MKEVEKLTIYKSCSTMFLKLLHPGAVSYSSFVPEGTDKV